MSRKNISLHEQIEERADKIIAKRGMAGLSDLIAVLVREEYERRGLDNSHPIDELHDSPSSNLVVAASSPEALAIVDAASGKLSLLKPVPPAPVRPPKPLTYREKRPKKLVE